MPIISLSRITQICKAILQNPVYMIADENAYHFFIQNNTDLFSEKAAFDNKHGIMAYNRTNQEKGRATKYLPASEWTVSVGKHPGLIPGKVWVEVQESLERNKSKSFRQEKGRATKYLPASEWTVSVGKHPGLIPGKVWVEVQESLERNKSKSFRKPRSNEALLTGLLFCSCGERMYPKMSKRKTADGKVIYTYVCKMKERSQKSACSSKNANGNTLDLSVTEQIKMLAEDKDTSACSSKNANGNTLDLSVTEQIKMLAEDKDTFIAQLKQSRRFYTDNRMDYEQRFDHMRKEKADIEKKIHSLVDSLADIGDSSAKGHVTKRTMNSGLTICEKKKQI